MMMVITGSFMSDMKYNFFFFFMPPDCSPQSISGTGLFSLKAAFIWPMLPPSTSLKFASQIVVAGAELGTTT